MRPDAIVLDLMMPVMSGAEFRREQVQDPALSPIPVILVTAASQGNVIARELAVHEFLKKPLSADALLAAVERVCDGRDRDALASS